MTNATAQTAVEYVWFYRRILHALKGVAPSTTVDICPWSEKGCVRFAINTYQAYIDPIREALAQDDNIVIGQTIIEPSGSTVIQVMRKG